MNMPGKGLIGFSRSLYWLQGASHVRSLGRRGSLGEWSAGQSEVLGRAGLRDTASRKLFSFQRLRQTETSSQSRGRRREQRLESRKTQNHRILHSILYLVQLLFVRGWWATLKNKKKLQRSLWVVAFHIGFTSILYYTSSLQKRKLFLRKE